MLIFIYNLMFPIVFLFFIPGLIYKLIKRSGCKKNYWERFAIYTKAKAKLISNLKFPVVWVHSVSVGETQLAVDFIKTWKKRNKSISFIVSTTTTTGQEMARNKLDSDIPVVYCPIDFFWFVRKTLKLIRPKILILFETEIWPNLINESYKAGVKVVQVNARISDHSFKGYHRFRFCISPFLSRLSLSCAQTDLDVERLRSICGDLNITRTGTMKFDQIVPAKLHDIDLTGVFGPGDNLIYLLAASTHPGEEKFIIEVFGNLIEHYPDLRLIIIPRHAERAPDIMSVLQEKDISFFRRTSKKPCTAFVQCLLADTTGEMLRFMKKADIVIMGKSFAGNTGGHNIIEPAILGKPVVTGTKLTNFRFVLKIMVDESAVISIDDELLESVIEDLLDNPEKRVRLGENAKKTVNNNIGATNRTIDEIEKLIRPYL